ncbi:MAG: enoyl-CoA hydratase/isomerase family protein, partial [Salibacteraceae bacterium]|nr:enoyl-CoA hydratase/isomerase family protein [Salibacteraceae bacterium]MDP4763956.1 enoyl-CoA hydratase/isomerase family protein [Salibacteraceae bacterium]
MNYSHLLVEKANLVATVTINRPDKLNALNKEVINQLSKCLSALESDEEVRCVILTGSGEKAFVAGADISEFAYFSVEQGSHLAADGQTKLFDLVEQL